MKQKENINVMWFKRDLRLRDNEALKASIESTRENAGTKLLLIYVFEPSVLSDPNYSERHWRFVTECLASLNIQLSDIGHSKTPNFLLGEWPDSTISNHMDSVFKCNNKIWNFHGEVCDVLKKLQEKYAIETIFSHQETGLKITFDRDKQVAAFCQKNRIGWKEFSNNGIVRKLKDKVTWFNRWKALINSPQIHPNLHLMETVHMDARWYDLHKGENLDDYWWSADENFQQGGEYHAHQTLESFLLKRAAGYSDAVPKPLESRTGCSRLSPYISWGCLSVRQVYQATEIAKEDAKKYDENLYIQYTKFLPRLRWQGQFIQQFESEDRMEFENINHSFNNLKKNVSDDNYKRWCTGNTGYPLVDALMRCLLLTGYINFRMRALLISFLTHHLFQDWKDGAKHLARNFTDFEPGLHYAQIQMQSGMGSQQTVRVYNPIKQSYDHDPDGHFISKWVPELSACGEYMHEPWKMSMIEQQKNKVIIGIDYPYPVVDIIKTGREAREKLYSPRKKQS